MTDEPRHAQLTERMWLPMAMVATAGMILAKTIGYGTFFRLPGARMLTAEPLVLIAIYIALTIRIGRYASRAATAAGVVAAGIEVAHLVQERFTALPGRWNGAVTLAFMLGTFLVWGWVGFRIGRSGRGAAVSCGSAAWAAVVTMTIAVAVGVAFEWWIAPQPLEGIRGWAEFQRSGWQDVAAFAIANTLDSVTTHLTMGPVIGCITGLAGFAVSRFS